MGEICQKKIEPGSMITVPYKVDQDCDLRWKFKTDGGDLGFGVQRKESETDSSPALEDVLTPTRVLVMCYSFAERVLLTPGVQSQGPAGWSAGCQGWVHLLALL